MRILHTSDWHLGRSFGDHRLLGDQAAMVDWLVRVVTEEAVDLVVIAGDLYDRSVPPAEAVELLTEALGRIRGGGAEVVAIAGNHDSAERVAAYDGLTDASGVLIRGGYRRAADVTVRRYPDGPLAIVTVPFLDPLLAPAALRDELGDGRPTHEAVLANAVGRARAEVPAGLRSLVVSHAFVTGAAPSPSERDLAVGTAGMVSAAVFDHFDYVALGHLHRAQAVAGTNHIRYSGAPLAYSFAETDHKTVHLVDLALDGSLRVEALAVPVGRPVATIRGRFEELLTDPGLALHAGAWVRVELTDPAPVLDAHRRLRERFPHLVEIERVASVPVGSATLDTARLRRSEPAELARTFWEEVTGEPVPSTVADLLVEALTLGAEVGS
jgi:DNA repair protein SbcD/Mre11